MTEQPQKGVVMAAVGAVWDSIVTPGGSSGLVRTFATVMGLLALPIVFLLFETGANLHVMVMAALWCGLAASMWWVWTVQQTVEATEGSFSAKEADTGKAPKVEAPAADEVTAAHSEQLADAPAEVATAAPVASPPSARRRRRKAE